MASAQPGSLDHTFVPPATNNSAVQSIALQPDGKVLAAGAHFGASPSGIIRLNADGSLDTSFDPGTGTGGGLVYATALQPDGKVLIAGEFVTYNGTPRRYIARLNANGTLDTSFGPGHGPANQVFTMALLPNGKVLIGGDFTYYDGSFDGSNTVYHKGIIRLNADGSPDSFGIPSGGVTLGTRVRDIAVQPDGKIIIGGYFSDYNFTTRNGIARLNADGTLDTSFGPATGAGTSVYSIAVQPDGKVLMTGNFSTGIARLNADGSWDTSFDPGTGVGGGYSISSIAIQPDGKILIGGGFISYNGIGRSNVARLNADGSLDTSFDPGTGVINSVNVFALQPDGKILIGGGFVHYNSTPRHNIARINGDGPTCTENVTVELRTDANSAHASWQILAQHSDAVLCQFTVPEDGITTPITENCCLPTGCYRLRVLDSGGDGFVTGGYQLRESGPNGRRIIDNLGNFNTGSTSAISAAYENGAFCLPIGDDKLIFSSCDKLDWTANKFIVVAENVAVTAQYGVTNSTSGYEFWFFDPNGRYNFRRFRSHATSDGYGTGALRANHFKVNGWTNSVTTPHLPNNVLLNVRVRGRVNGNNLPYGAACLFKIDAALAACPRVKLQDDPANVDDYSCGVSRNFGGGSNAMNRIYANPPQPIPAVASANVRYQFRFRIPGENICIVRPPQTSARMVLNWTSGTLLQCSKTYEVDVRVSLNGGATWCFGPAGTNQATACADTEDWGKVCNVTINPCAMPNGGNNALMGHSGQGEQSVALYPNPNNGEQLFLGVNSVEDGVNTATVDIYDLTGKRVMARAIAVTDGFVKTTIDLGGELSSGVYVVHITAGTTTHTERLVIAH